MILHLNLPMQPPKFLKWSEGLILHSSFAGSRQVNYGLPNICYESRITVCRRAPATPGLSYMKKKKINLRRSGHALQERFIVEIDRGDQISKKPSKYSVLKKLGK